MCNYHEIEYWYERNRVRKDDIDELNVSKLIELMFKGDLHCFQGCFRKQTGRKEVETCEP